MRELRPQGDEGYGTYADGGTPGIDGGKRAEVGNPLLDEVGRHALHRQSEEILDLRGEDGQGDTRGEAHNDGIRDVLDNSTQMEHAEHDKEDTRHERGNGKALEAVLLDDTINNNNERARGTTNLHFGASEDRDEKTCHDGGDDAFLGRYA